MKNLKRIAAGIMASALCFTAVPALNASQLSAYAAGQTAGTSAALDIPDSDIQLSYTPFTDDKYIYDSYSIKNNGNNTYSTDWLATSNFVKQKITFTLTVNKSDKTDTPEKLRKLLKMDINLKYQTGDREAGSDISYKYREDHKYYSITLRSGNRYSYYYEVELPYTVYGNRKKYEIVFNGDTSELRGVSNLEMHGNGNGYYSMGVTCKGLKLNVLYKKNPNIDNSKYYAWLRNLGRYVYSLYDITGIKPDDLYLSLGDEEAICPNADHFRISEDQNSVLVCVEPDLNAEIDDTIQNNKMNWALMHELSHCFSYKGKKGMGTTTFAEAFNYSLDDPHTNARGATAMQNCVQLRNIGIKIDGVQDLGTYKDALSNAYKYKINSPDEKPIYSVIDVLGRYANTDNGNGWVNLENYFSNYYYSASSMPVEAVNSAIDFMQENTPYSYTLDQDNTTFVYMFNTGEVYRFVNSMYYLCSNTSGYGKYNFRNFLRNFVTPEVFVEYSAIANKNFELQEANINNIRGDVNNDGTVDRNDYNILYNVINGNSSIKPLGYLNADCYGDYSGSRRIFMSNETYTYTFRDGFINNKDLRALDYYLNNRSWPSNGSL